MSISSLVEKITSDLNDDAPNHENATWSKKYIRDWLLEGLNLCYDNRPDLFIQRVIMQVTTCSIVQDKCDCDTYKRVLGQCTASGRVTNLIPKTNLDINLRWPMGFCASRRRGSGTKLTGYAIDDETDTLYIWPEIPPTETVYVLVECSHRPTDEELESDDYELPHGTDVAVTQWALFRAISMDAEVSNSAMTRSQIHYKAFFDVLGLSTDKSVVVHTRGNS